MGICVGLREKEVSPVTGRRQNYIRQCHEKVLLEFRNMHHSPGRHTISNTTDMRWTMAHETIAGPVAFREDTHDGPGPDDPRFVVMAHPSEKWEGQEARTGSGYDAIKRLHIRLLFEAGCRDSGFPGFNPAFREKAADCMHERRGGGLAVLWPSRSTHSFFPQTPAEGRVDTDSRGAPCRIRQDDEK